MKDPEEEIQQKEEPEIIDEPMRKSRLTEHIQDETKKNIALTVLGIVALVAVLWIFGVPMLIGFSTTIDKIKNTDEITPAESNDLNYVAPPTLDALPDATNSAEIVVSGYATNKDQINLYVNGSLVDKTTTESDKSFTFRDVTLDSGKNEIKVKAVAKNKKQSDYSNEVIITYSNKPPEITIDSPQDGQKISKDNRNITVTGKTSDGVKVTVNGFWAIEQAGGKFSYDMVLAEGDNTIKIEAVDDGGNKTAKEIKVKVE